MKRNPAPITPAGAGYVRADTRLKEESRTGFMVGWDACLKHLGEIPWDEAMNEIANHVEANCSEKTNSSKLAEV